MKRGGSARRPALATRGHDLDGLHSEHTGLTARRGAAWPPWGPPPRWPPHVRRRAVDSLRPRPKGGRAGSPVGPDDREPPPRGAGPLRSHAPCPHRRTVGQSRDVAAGRNPPGPPGLARGLATVPARPLAARAGGPAQRRAGRRAGAPSGPRSSGLARPPVRRRGPEQAGRPHLGRWPVVSVCASGPPGAALGDASPGASVRDLRHYTRFRPWLVPLEQWLVERTMRCHFFDLDRTPAGLPELWHPNTLASGGCP